MKIIYPLSYWIMFESLLLPSIADNLPSIPGDCMERLEQFVPQEVNTGAIALRAIVNSTYQNFMPTEEMRIKQLTEQYFSSEKYQKEFPTVEAFIEIMLPLIAQEEKDERSSPCHHSKVEAIVSATNTYARYFDAADGNTPTQEVFQMKVDSHAWRTIRVDLLQKRIVEKIEKNRNEYQNYFSSITPQEAHRSAWQMYSVMLNMEKRNGNIAQVLCESGQVQLANILLQVEFKDEAHCIFKTQTPVPNGKMNTEYELERGKHIRLLRYELLGPELATKVTYEYSDTDALWPSKQHLVDRNILSDQTLRDRNLEIIEVAPAAKWDFNAILNALMKKYSDYPYVQE